MYLSLPAGYRSDGYNKDRYSRTGYNCQSVDENLLSEDGLSIGFNYSCQVSSISECLSTAATGFPNSEVRLTYTVHPDFQVVNFLKEVALETHVKIFVQIVPCGDHELQKLI